MVVNDDPGLRDMRLSGRKAMDVFRSFRCHSLLRGCLASANLDFGHNSFNRGSNCPNGVDPKETLRELLISGALAAISTIFIFCPHKPGDADDPAATEQQLKRAIEEVAKKSGVVLHVLSTKRSRGATLFAFLHLRSLQDDPLDILELEESYARLRARFPTSDSCERLAVVKSALVAEAKQRSTMAKRPAIVTQEPLLKASVTSQPVFYRKAITNYLEDCRKYHLHPSCQPNLLRVSDPHLLQELKAESTQNQNSRICGTCLRRGRSSAATLHTNLATRAMLERTPVNTVTSAAPAVLGTGRGLVLWESSTGKLHTNPRCAGWKAHPLTVTCLTATSNTCKKCCQQAHIANLRHAQAASYM